MYLIMLNFKTVAIAKIPPKEVLSILAITIKI